MPRIQGTLFPQVYPCIQNTSLISRKWLPGIYVVNWTTDTISSTYQWSFTNELIDHIFFESTKTYSLGIRGSTLLVSFPSAGTVDFYIGGDNNSGSVVSNVSTAGVNVSSNYLLTSNTLNIYPIEYINVGSIDGFVSKTFSVPLVQNQEPSRFTLWIGYVGTDGGVIPSIAMGYTDNTFISGTYYGCQAGMGTAAWMGPTLDIWHNSWSTSHSVLGQWEFINIGIIPGKAQPNRMWLIKGLASRWDATFGVQISCTVYTNSTKVVDRVKVFTDIFERFDTGVNKFAYVSAERD